MSEVQETTPAPPPAFRIDGDRVALFGALVKARAAFKPLENNQTGEVVKDGRKLYSYDYADLASVQEATAPALAAHGLVIMQPWWSDGEGYVSSTILAHVSGALMATETWFKNPGTWQQVGSALSYVQRYQWRAILGISASKDDDDGANASGNGASNGHSNGKAQPRPATRAPQAAPEPRPAQAAKPRPQGAASDAQLQDISDVAAEMGWNRDKGEAFMKTALGYVAELEALSTGDAKKLLEAMVVAQNQRAAS